MTVILIILTVVLCHVQPIFCINMKTVSHNINSRIDLKSEIELLTLIYHESHNLVHGCEMKAHFLKFDYQALLKSNTLKKMQLMINKWETSETYIRKQVQKLSKTDRKLLDEVIIIYANCKALLGHVYWKTLQNTLAMNYFESACPMLWEYQSIRQSSSALIGSFGWLDCYAALYDMYSSLNSQNDANLLEKDFTTRFPWLTEIFRLKHGNMISLSKKTVIHELKDISLKDLIVLEQDVQDGWNAAERLRTDLNAAAADFIVSENKSTQIVAIQRAKSSIINIEKEFLKEKLSFENFIDEYDYLVHSSTSTIASPQFRKLRELMFSQLRKESNIYIQALEFAFNFDIPLQQEKLAQYFKAFEIMESQHVMGFQDASEVVKVFDYLYQKKDHFSNKHRTVKASHDNKKYVEQQEEGSSHSYLKLLQNLTLCFFIWIMASVFVNCYSNSKLTLTMLLQQTLKSYSNMIHSSLESWSKKCDNDNHVSLKNHERISEDKQHKKKKKSSNSDSTSKKHIAKVTPSQQAILNLIRTEEETRPLEVIKSKVSLEEVSTPQVNSNCYISDLEESKVIIDGKEYIWLSEEQTYAPTTSDSSHVQESDWKSVTSHNSKTHRNHSLSKSKHPIKIIEPRNAKTTKEKTVSKTDAVKNFKSKSELTNTLMKSRKQKEEVPEVAEFNEDGISLTDSEGSGVIIGDLPSNDSVMLNNPFSEQYVPIFLSAIPFPSNPMYHEFMDPISYVIHIARTQIEYYFSAENLIKDSFLRSQMDSLGFVTLHKISMFRRIAELHASPDMLIMACRLSEVLEIIEMFSEDLGHDGILSFFKVRTKIDSLRWVIKS